MSGLDLTLTDDQRAFGISVERFFAERYDAERAWREGASASAWMALTELGVPAAGIPESAGGIGGGMAELAVAMIAAGRHLAVEPVLATAVLGAAVLRQASGSQAQALLGGVADGSVQLATAYEEASGRFDPAVVAATARPGPNGWRLDGVKAFALNAPAADVLLVTARISGDRCDPEGISLFTISRETPGVSLRPFRTQDGLPAADLMLDAVTVPKSAALGPPGRALEVLAPAMEEACVAVCAGALGAMEASLAATVAYLGVRRQFGRPLASFQALQHRMVDMHMDIEETRSLLEAAMEALDGPPSRERSRAVTALKIHTAKAAIAIGQEAVQLHGGVGIAADGKIGRWYKRLLACATLFGDAAFHTGRYPLANGDGSIR